MVLYKNAPPGSNSAKARSWVEAKKRVVVSKIRKATKPGSVKEWVSAAGMSRNKCEELPHNFRRWRAGLFDIPKVKCEGVHPQHKQCAMCGEAGQKATAVHYFLECPHHEVVEHREQMLSEFHVAFADPELRHMQNVWGESEEDQQIRGMVCAIPSIKPEPEGFWGNIDKSVRAFLRGVGEAKTFWEDVDDA